MTLSTSAVAVCCCNDSRSSFSNRAFSIAITAWLPVGEWPDFPAIDRDNADRLVPLDHRYCNQCLNAEDLDGANRYWIAVDIGPLRAHVSDVGRPQCRGSAGERDARARMEQRSTSFHKTWRVRAVARRHAKTVSLTEPQGGMRGLAKARRVRENRLE